MGGGSTGSGRGHTPCTLPVGCRKGAGAQAVLGNQVGLRGQKRGDEVRQGLSESTLQAGLELNHVLRHPTASFCGPEGSHTQ